MERRLEIRGLPRALARDAWWFGGEGAGSGGAAPARADGSGAGGGVGPVLVALVLLGDALFYAHPAGLSLAVFAAAILGAAAFLRRRWHDAARPGLLLAAAALPVIDHVQALSVAFLSAGLLLGLAWLGLGGGAAPRLLAGAGSIARALPLSGAAALIRLIRQQSRRAVALTGSRDWLRAWAFPVGGALILAALLAEANPVLSGWAARLIAVDIDVVAMIERGLFWLGMALLLWPLLTCDPAARPAGPRPRHKGVALPGLNAGSVANALVVFNLVLGVQTLMDLGFLWAGAELPDGMSHAEYAHRGAYPLLATALLAGGFALSARPWLGERRALLPLMALWLGQNVLLCASAVYRLVLYVEAFGLTYLRLHAGIWMALVAVGLVLTGWQILRRKPNRWLVTRTAVLGLSVLYLSGFINFAAVIARHNLARPDYDDLRYICDLGPMAAAEIRASGRRLPCHVPAPRTEGWRDWGLRKWQVSRYLERAKAAGAVHEDPRRR